MSIIIVEAIGWTALIVTGATWLGASLADLIEYYDDDDDIEDVEYFDREE